MCNLFINKTGKKKKPYETMLNSNALSFCQQNRKSACGLAEQRRTHKQKVVSSSPVSANMFVSLSKILNLDCLVDPSDIWVAVMGDVII